MKKKFLKIALLTTIITIGIAINNIFINGDTSRNLLGWTLLWIITFSVGLVVSSITDLIFKYFFKSHTK